MMFKTFARVLYYSTDAGGVVRLGHTASDLGASWGTAIEVDLPNTYGALREILIELHAIPRFGVESNKTTLELNGIPSSGRVYEVELYQYDTDALDTYAASLLRAPYQEPQEVVWPRIVKPAATLTIIGYPGGDNTGEVEEWSIEIGNDGGATTRASFGGVYYGFTTEAIRMAIADAQAATMSEVVRIVRL